MAFDYWPDPKSRVWQGHDIFFLKHSQQRHQKCGLNIDLKITLIQLYNSV